MRVCWNIRNTEEKLPVSLDFYIQTQTRGGNCLAQRDLNTSRMGHWLVNQDTNILILTTTTLVYDLLAHFWPVSSLVKRNNSSGTSEKIFLRRFPFKMVTQEDPKLSSFHKHTRSTATYGTTSWGGGGFPQELAEGAPTTDTGNAEEGLGHNLSVNPPPSPHLEAHKPLWAQNPSFSRKCEDFERHMGHSLPTLKTCCPW